MPGIFSGAAEGEKVYFLSDGFEKYKTDVSLAGEFVRTVQASPLSENEKQEIISLGLKAINGEEVDL